ncbi:MAG TPA: ABC transporter permease [Acidimicrobiales bacterium]|nr:ABC transporter permease [Acidimicrobiales bacterium]HUI04141.1 ABC transporter permease [Acidimicrobiales bacterium]
MGVVAITLQDLRFRARQFIIAVAGAGLVFAMGLLLAGLAAGFTAEINQTVSTMGANAWLVAQGSPGRLAAFPPMTSYAAVAAAQVPGVTRAAPVIVAPQAAQSRGQTSSVVLIGIEPGHLGAPQVASGRPVAHNGEAVVDTALGVGIGQHFVVANHDFTVVGTVGNRTLLAGQPDAYVTLSDAQSILYGGRPLIGAVLISGVPHQVPHGLQLFTNAQVESASLNQMAQAVSSIGNSRVFMWVIAAFIVAALVYVTALQRTRDFAVLKALGSSSGLLFVGLVVQAVIVALAAAAVAAIIVNFMTGLFAQPVDIPTSAFVILPVAALVVGIGASLAALRRAVSADPALAFAGG